MIEFDPVLVHEWLSRSARRYPTKTAVICGKQRWTYEQIDLASDRLASALLYKGIRPQDRVVIFLDNSIETIISIYGILKAGGVFVVLTGSMKADKLRYIINNADARIVITHTRKAQPVQEALRHPLAEHLVVWAGPHACIPEELASQSIAWDRLPALHDTCPDPCDIHQYPRDIIDIDLATLIYTSGSTGEPKGVMSTHHNMISAARSIIQYIGNTADDVILCVLPLSFDYGLYQVIMAFMFGGTVVLENSFVYLHRLLERVAQEKVTGFPIVPTIVAMMLTLEDLEKYDLSRLRYLTNTGAALPVAHIRKLRRIMPHVSLISMFGLTECKRVGYLPPHQLDHRPTSVGKAMPNCQVLVVDEQDMPVKPGQAGQLLVRGSNVMQGYWKDAALTDKTFQTGRYPADRTLYTGDTFTIDDEGFLYFQGRNDDMIKSRGERISAKEVENILHTMEGIHEAAVVGLPDELLGQAIKAYIVPTKKGDLLLEHVLAYCSAHMENYMIPKQIEIVDALPRTTNGKINKKLLKV